jgi:hypothetical protein
LDEFEKTLSSVATLTVASDVRDDNLLIATYYLGELIKMLAEEIDKNSHLVLMLHYAKYKTHFFLNQHRSANLELGHIRPALQIKKSDPIEEKNRMINSCWAESLFNSLNKPRVEVQKSKSGETVFVETIWNKLA